MRFFNINIGLVIHTLAVIIIAAGSAMLLPFLVALGYGEGDAEAHLIAALITIIIGGIAFQLTKNYPGEITHREGICIVALCWFLLGPLGSLPLYFFGHHTFNFIPERAAITAYPTAPDGSARHGSCANPGHGGPGSEFCSPVNCLYEAISGFTTTGSSILNAPSLWENPVRLTAEELPHGIQLWRHLMHFLGGLGIIILSIAIMPLLGVGGMQLFKVEVAGPTADKLTPRIAATARMLWSLYVVLSVITIVAMWLGGVPFFSAVCFGFSAIATGGFAPLGSSAAGLHNMFAEIVLCLTMLISSISFTLHYLFLNKKFTCYFKDIQTRYYISIITITSLIAALVLYHKSADLGFFQSLHTALFQVVSIISTTALSTTDYSSWEQLHPLLAALLISLTMIGGCAGSTAGGPKVIRFIIVIKHTLRELYLLVHPKAVASIKIGNRPPISQNIINGVFGFFTLYIITSFIAAIIFCGCGYDLVSSFTSVLAHIGNIGSSFGLAGQYGSYNFVNGSGKLILIILMILGRLELYNFIILLTRAFWKK